jgi:hypothetical protein
MVRPATFINLEEAGNSCTKAAVKGLSLWIGLDHEIVCSCTPVHTVTLFPVLIR